MQQHDTRPDFQSARDRDCLFPVEVKPSEHHRVWVGGESVFVYPVKINPTYQYADIAAPASMASFELRQTEVIRVQFPYEPKRVVAHPLSRGIEVSVCGNQVELQLKEPGHFTVEAEGHDIPLFLFANPPEIDPPRSCSAQVIYFGPGVHQPGRIDLQSGQTLYLAPGAYVHGYVYSEDTADICIKGRGILSSETYEKGSMLNPRGQRQKQVELRQATRVLIEGVILLDASEWMLNPVDCRDVLIDNVKVIGWRRNSDALDPVNAVGLHVRHCFFKTQDDGVTLKGRTIPSNPMFQNILVEGNVLWQNWMRGYVVGCELADITTFRNIVFRDTDILRSGHNPNSHFNRDAALAVNNLDNAVVEDVRFENIRVEQCDRLIRLAIHQNQFSHSVSGIGQIRNIHFRDITVQQGPAVVEITGFDVARRVENITIENLRIAGKLIHAPDELHFVSNAYIRDVKFVTPQGTVSLIHSDPFEEDMNHAYAASLGCESLEWHGDANGISQRVIDFPYWMPMPGRYEAPWPHDGSAMTLQESIGNFQKHTTYQISAYFKLTVDDATRGSLAGLGISTHPQGVLAKASCNDGVSGINLLLRTWDDCGRVVRLQLESCQRGQTTFTMDSGHKRAALVPNLWHKLTLTIIRKNQGVFDLAMTLAGCGVHGQNHPVVLIRHAVSGLKLPELADSEALFAGLGLMDKPRNRYAPQAVDQFWVLGIDSAPASVDQLKPCL